MFQTERLTLRRWIAEDFEPFAELHADPAVAQFVTAGGKPLGRFQAWQSFCGLLGHWQMRGFGMFAVIETATDEFVGRVGPWNPEGWPSPEIGWAIRSKFWGRGYASEAARRSVEYAFTTLDWSQVSSFIDPTNARSIKVAERLGEHLSGSVILPDIPTRTIMNYVLNKSEWESR